MLKKLVVICCIAVLLTSCGEPIPEDDTFLTIVNDSDEDILWMFGLEDYGEWYDKKSSWIGNDRFFLLKGNIYVYGLNSGALNENLRRGWIKYWFFNLDSIKTIPWERICAERIIIKEITFNTLGDFERCNFEITYP